MLSLTIFDGNELNIKYHLHSTPIKLFTEGSLTYVTYEATQNKDFKESYRSTLWTRVSEEIVNIYTVALHRKL